MILTLEAANQPFHLTLWLIIMHHNTKFGDKWFSGSEDIVWTNAVNDILKFHCNPDLENSNPFTISQDTLAYSKKS